MRLHLPTHETPLSGRLSLTAGKNSVALLYLLVYPPSPLIGACRYTTINQLRISSHCSTTTRRCCCNRSCVQTTVHHRTSTCVPTPISPSISLPLSGRIPLTLTSPISVAHLQSEVLATLQFLRKIFHRRRNNPLPQDLQHLEHLIQELPQKLHSLRLNIGQVLERAPPQTNPDIPHQLPHVSNSFSSVTLEKDAICSAIRAI